VIWVISLICFACLLQLLSPPQRSRQLYALAQPALPQAGDLSCKPLLVMPTAVLP
jgi:hypothetical protein